MNIIARPLRRPVPSTRAAGVPAEQRLLFDDVAWPDYVAIGNALRDRPALRLTYDRGRLEIMTTSPEHEIRKKRLSRLIEVLAEELGLPYATAGNMTFQREDLAQGLEADDCFWIAHEPQMRAKLTWDPALDPPPDLVVEIEVTRRAVRRMALYAALGVPEVWCFDGESLRVYALQADQTYRVTEQSPTFPAVPLTGLASFLQPDTAEDSLSWLRSLRAWVRKQAVKPKRKPGPKRRRGR